MVILKNKTAIVTGASGFKGSYLTATLLNLGVKVFGFVRTQNNNSSSYNLLHLNRAKNFTPIPIDITDFNSVFEKINSILPDFIFHLGAKALVPAAIRDPKSTYNVNVSGTINILEACRMLGVHKKICLLVCSTDHVFGNVEPDQMPENGFPENAYVSYCSPYDTSKAMMELACRSYNLTYADSLPYVGITRCANVFGIGDTAERRVIPFFINEAKHSGSIPLKYRFNGRQFIHVTDAISGYIKAIVSLPEIKENCPTFHFANDVYSESNNYPYIKMENLAKTIAKNFSASVDTSNCIDYAPNENRVQALNCNKTKKLLQWKPTMSFSRSINYVCKQFELDDPEKSIQEDIDLTVDNWK
jgi:CDP-glucose 4,6-dehydratase